MQKELKISKFGVIKLKNKIYNNIIIMLIP